VPITTKVVSSNPVHDEVYSMQHNVIKFVSYLRQVGKFSSGTPVFSTNKTDRHDITEILLKVALNTINEPSNSITYVDDPCGNSVLLSYRVNIPGRLDIHVQPCDE
jgi:hypothetical protein